MSINYQDYIQTQSNYNIKNYLNLSYSTLTDLFGDYFTFNELIKYNHNKLYLLDVAIKTLDDGIGIITIWINKEFVKDIEFKNFGSELIYRLEELEYKQKNKKFYYTEGRIGLDFFNEYIKKRLHKQCLKKINQIWTNLNEDEKYIEIKTIYFAGMNQCYYKELILLDVDSKYIPVLIENINTSSPYCLEKSFWEYDDENDDINKDKNKEKIIGEEEIVNNLFPIFNKEKLKNVVNEL